MKLHQAIINAVCGAALLGMTVASPVRSYASTSEKMAEIQEVFTYLSAGVTILAAGVSLVTTAGCPLFWCTDSMPMKDGIGTGSFNIDIAGALVDAAAIWVTSESGTEWKGLEDGLQAAVRKIGEAEDLQESGVEEAFVDKSEILVESLDTAGLEALEDPSGNIPKTLDEIISSPAKIQDAFGTVSVSQLQSGSSNGSNSGSNTNSGSNGTSTTTVPSNTNLQTGVNPENLTAEELDLLRARRREAHLQKVATAGAARAHLMKVIAKREKEAVEKMKEVGKADGLVANVKLVTADDLYLGQLQNTMNSVLGQEVANEAAAALQSIEE